MDVTGHLNGHQRDTLAHVFGHPLSHNIEWHSVHSLLNAVGDVHETSRGHVVVTIGNDTETFEPPRTKDLDAEQLSTLRRLLRRAGYGPDNTAGDGPDNTAGNGPDNTAGNGPEEVPA